MPILTTHFSKGLPLHRDSSLTGALGPGTGHRQTLQHLVLQVQVRSRLWDKCHQPHHYNHKSEHRTVLDKISAPCKARSQAPIAEPVPSVLPVQPVHVRRHQLWQGPHRNMRYSLYNCIQVAGSPYTQIHSLPFRRSREACRIGDSRRDGVSRTTPNRLNLHEFRICKSPILFWKSKRTLFCNRALNLPINYCTTFAAVFGPSSLVVESGLPLSTTSRLLLKSDWTMSAKLFSSISSG